MYTNKRVWKTLPNRRSTFRVFSEPLMKPILIIYEHCCIQGELQLEISDDTYQLPLWLACRISYSYQQSVDHLYSSFVVHQCRLVIAHKSHFPRQLGILANFANRNCHYCHSRCVHVTYPRLKMLRFFSETPSEIYIACDIQWSDRNTSHFHNISHTTLIALTF